MVRHHHRLGVLDPIQDSLLNYDANSPQSMSCLIIICIRGSVFWNKENKILLGERYIKCPQCTGLPVLQWGNNIICSPMCKNQRDMKYLCMVYLFRRNKKERRVAI